MSYSIVQPSMIKYVFTALCKCHDIMKWMNKAEQDGIKSDHIKKDLFSVKKVEP